MEKYVVIVNPMRKPTLGDRVFHSQVEAAPADGDSRFITLYEIAVGRATMVAAKKTSGATGPAMIWIGPMRLYNPSAGDVIPIESAISPNKLKLPDFRVS
jgi:hypothetical protein